MVSGFIASVQGHIISNKFVVLAKVRHSQRMNDSLIPLWITTEREGRILVAKQVIDRESSTQHSVFSSKRANNLLKVNAHICNCPCIFNINRIELIFSRVKAGIASSACLHTRGLWMIKALLAITRSPGNNFSIIPQFSVKNLSEVLPPQALETWNCSLRGDTNDNFDSVVMFVWWKRLCPGKKVWGPIYCGPYMDWNFHLKCWLQIPTCWIFLNKQRIFTAKIRVELIPKIQNSDFQGKNLSCLFFNLNNSDFTTKMRVV